MKRLRRSISMAVLYILGVTPWAAAQVPQPDLPAVCYPLTAFAGPTLYNVFFGVPVFRFPFQ